MSYTLGKNIQYTFFGKADGSSVGVVLHGLPAGIYINQNGIKDYIARLDPGETNGFTAHRQKAADFRILAGMKDGKTCAAPLCAVFFDGNAEKKPAPTTEQSTLSFSRLNAALCFCGAVAKGILERNDIIVGAHIAAIGNLQDKPFDPAGVSADDLKDPGRYPFPTLNFGVGETMQAKIDLSAKKRETIGGVIEIGVLGFPAGVGDPMFDGIENVLAKNLFAVDGLCGVEYGAGFYGATLKGSEHNDAFCLKNDAIRTVTNQAGGILGGITTGMPLIIKATLQPPPPAHCEEETDEDCNSNDACIVPAMVPVVESITAMTLLDLLAGETSAQ